MVIRRAEPLLSKVRPKPFEKKRVNASKGRRGVGGPGTCTRIVEITSGRAIAQQGLATTCKDPAYKGKPRCWEGFGLAHGFVVVMKVG